MKSIILIAGIGERLKPLTNSIPKCLIEVNGKTILDNALEILEQNGIKETILVIGYLGDQIKKKIGNKFGDMKISYIENPIYDKTNTSYSLWLALKNLDLDDALLVLEGDVFFEERLLKDFIKDSFDNSTIVQRYNPNLNGSFIAVNGNNTIIDWVHKKVRPSGFKIEDKFKTANIHKFGKAFLRDFLIPNLKKHVNEKKGAEPIEYIMQDVVTNKNAKINTFETGNLKWFEIDNLKELKIAEKIFAKKLSLDEIKALHGGYWRYNLLDFHYLINLYFPTKKLLDKIKKQLPVLIENYPSTQKVIASLLSKWKNKSYFNEKNIIVSNGSSEAIRTLNRIINKVTVPIPTFNEYIKLPQRKLNYFLLPEENKFKLDVNELIKEIKKSKSDFTVINNPNNPVGGITPRKDIIKLLETGINVIVDEAFIDFSIEDSVEDLVEKYKNLIIVKTVTKTMGLAGLRLGYVLTTNQKIKEQIKKILPIWNVNSIAEYFIEIFPEFEEDYWNSIEKTKKDRDELFKKLKGIPFLEPYETKSNFIFCKTKISSKKIAESLYKNYNIILRSQLNQKILKSDNYIRIAVRNKEDNEKLISALKKIKRE